MREHDFHYALENTKVILPPQKRLETFGTTVLNYHLITEEMDAVNRMLVREGRIHAQKPELVTVETELLFVPVNQFHTPEQLRVKVDVVSMFCEQWRNLPGSGLHFRRCIRAVKAIEYGAYR